MFPEMDRDVRGFLTEGSDRNKGKREDEPACIVGRIKSEKSVNSKKEINKKKRRKNTNLLQHLTKQLDACQGRPHDDELPTKKNNENHAQNQPEKHHRKAPWPKKT